MDIEKLVNLMDLLVEKEDSVKEIVDVLGGNE